MIKLATICNPPYRNVCSPSQNHLLGALPVSIYERLFPYLELVTMHTGDVLYEAGGEFHYAFFPVTCIVSKFNVMECGATTEVALIGNDGFVGVALLMGGATINYRAIVRSEGFAYRLKRQHFMQEFNRKPEGAEKLTFFNLMLRYAQLLITQISQSAVCNRFHSTDQHLCKWLLQSLDLLESNELTVTHESIGHMLGVRRESITEAARKLQSADLIDYKRGHITVLNRAGLEARVCECYQVVKMESDRLMRMVG